MAPSHNHERAAWGAAAGPGWDAGLVAVDRPGVGQSDPLPGRRLLAWPDDVALLADGLGLDRFAVLGHSGGGPFATACAHALPERVTALGVVCGFAPMDRPTRPRAWRPVWRRRFPASVACLGWRDCSRPHCRASTERHWEGP